MNPLSHNPAGLLDGQILPTKANAETVARQIAADCRNGFTDLLETVTRLRAIIHTCEAALTELDPDILTEVAKYGKAGAEILSARIEPMEAGTKYNYAGTGDKEYAALKAGADVAGAKLKEREKLLRTIKNPIQETDPETGELYEVRPAEKSSKTTYKVTLLATPMPGGVIIEAKN